MLRKTDKPLIVLLTITVVYIASRSYNESEFALIYGFGFVLYLFFEYLKKTRLSRYSDLYKKTIVAILLVYSFFVMRYNSWDGARLYFRNMYLVSEHLISAPLDGANIPYLSELFLGLINRFLPINFVMVTFGAAFVGLYFALKKLFKESDRPVVVQETALLAIFGSPTILMLLGYEFKVELFLLLVCTGVFYLYHQTLNQMRLRVVALLSLLAGIGVLIKISFLPLALVILFIIFLRNLSFKVLTALLIPFVLALGLWVLYSPTTYGFNSKTTPFRFFALDNRDPEVYTLSRNSEKLAECSWQGKKSDYSEFMEYGGVVRNLLTFPFQYLTLYKASPGFYTFHIGNIGPFLFFGGYLLCYSVYKSVKKRDKKSFYFYLPGLAFWFLHLKMAGPVLWYLVPIFPLIGLSLGEFVYGRSDKFKKVFGIVLKSFTFAHALVLFSIMIYFSAAYTNSNPAVTSEKIYGYSSYLEQLPPEDLVLDAAEHRYVVFLPFLKSYDSRIIRSNYYFAASEKSVDAMREELLSKNIRYILARKNFLENSWYKGCTRENNLVLKSFLEKHAEEVFSVEEGGSSVWEIYKIK